MGWLTGWLASRWLCMTSSQIKRSTYAYIDNVKVYSHIQADHDHNLKWFMVAVKKYLTLDREKCSYNLLGYIVKNGTPMPDPDRLKPPKGITIPGNMPASRLALGMFVHASQWRTSFSKNTPIDASIYFSFVLFRHQRFQNMKNEIANSVISTLDPSIPLIVETGASFCAIAASLRQSGRPVAFFAKTLRGPNDDTRW